MHDFTDHLVKVRNDILATDILGCVTGSSLTADDMDSWADRPDIDVFCYSPYAMVHALDVVEYQLGFKPGGDEVTTDAGERWKARKTREDGIGRGRDIATCKMTDGEVTVNVTYRKGERSAMDVIARFDMSIVLMARDIQTGMLVDMRMAEVSDDVAEVIGTKGGSRHVAVPNPFRRFDGTVWNASKWLRQWGRVLKYAERGFDTLPMAKFYANMIDEVTASGQMFKTDASKKAFDAFVEEFADIKTQIDEWVEKKEAERE